MKQTFFDWNVEQWHAFFCVLDSMADLGVSGSPEERAVMIAKFMPKEIPEDFTGE